MANLLANPNAWRDTYEFSPPECWNGSEYSVQYEAYVWGYFTDIYLDGEAAPGDVIAGTVLVSTEMAEGCYLVLSAYDSVAENWSVVEYVHVPDSTLTSFSFSDLPHAGLMLRVASSSSGNSQLYGYDYSATITPVQEVEIIANDDHSTVQAGATVVTNVLANDTVDGAPATLQNVTLPTITRHPGHGTVEVLVDGSIRYTPDESFSGTDSYEYEIEAREPDCYEINSANSIFMYPEDLGDIPGFVWGETEGFAIAVGDYSYGFSYNQGSDRYDFSSDSEYPECGNLGSGTMTFGDSEVCISNWENGCY